ncbi:BolA/IbaG family iron-sulfur metabolism protein [Nitrosomonas sp.]|uniref:BolA/IbaG family iron-sulfur metabolism protein n=1 Tax=Nitrosomonas sp. TaxID=42353 RepID=UPI0025FA0708|nr:BolA/IbaG family iron-sulfur metabolism protein [Nitrosomonas sp.]
MNIKNSIEIKLLSLQPRFLEVINESHKHNVPEGSESHFKVTIVSDEFNGKILLARHRMISSILADELHSIHALAMHTMTTEEWIKRSGKLNESPPCLGGSKIE